MDGSDDYFFDDIVFDDQTLAILDQEEKKHQAQVAAQQQKALSNVQVPPVPPRVEPVAKRQKTHNGWTPGVGAASSSRAMEEDLPEISLHGDGSYAIGHRPPTAHVPVQQKAPQALVPPRQIPNYQNSNSRVAPPRPPIPQPSHFAQSSTPRIQTPSVQNNRAFHPVQTPAPVHPTQPPAQINPVRAPVQAPVQSPGQLALQQKVAELQKKLDELSRDHSNVQASLKKENDMRLAREGEVAILRKSMEKTAQNHAAQIALLRTEKETADSKQAQMQKEMKDEVERLRTQFLFRQQELEMASRKVPGSVKPKKPAREFPSTPLPVPHAMAGWNSTGASSSKMRIDETPVRPSRHPPPQAAARVSPSKPSRKSPEKKKSFMLPGFENAFETSTPIRSPSRRVDKGKGRMFVEPEPVVPVPQPSQIFRPLSQISQGHTQPRVNEGVFGGGGDAQMMVDSLTPVMPSAESRPDSQDQVKDEDMEVTPPESDEDPLDEQEPFDPINWKSELCRVILTHTYPGEGRIAFQHLISCDPNDNPEEEYSNSCMKIMEVVASPLNPEEYAQSAHIVTDALVTLLVELSYTQQLLSMSVLFNLMSCLIMSLPRFAHLLLSCESLSRERRKISLIDLISKVIADHWKSKYNSEGWLQFATELVSLLQALCFYQPDDPTSQFEIFTRDHKNLLTILDGSPPPKLLESLTSLMMLLSTHHDLYQPFLKPSVAQKGSEPPKFLLIERLGCLLTDTASTPIENAKIHILVFFAQLAIAHPEAHAALGASPVLIPFLVLYTSQLTDPIWEDDGTLAASQELTASYIQTLNQTLFLLYQIIFAVEPIVNLRAKLQHAPHRPFNSIKHIFIVAFGRMSYCDAPSWIEPAQRPELEYLAVVASEILELMVDGPEGDSVWAAFQADEEGGVDEGEMEAQFIS